MDKPTVIQGASCRLYPNAAQAEKLEQWSGACRFMWNRLLDRQKALYEAEGKFLWRAELQAAMMEIKSTEGLEWVNAPATKRLMGFPPTYAYVLIPPASPMGSDWMYRPNCAS